MRVFVTGATGFIGSAVVDELQRHGHQVIGLCRSDEKAAALAATGAEILRGSLEDAESLREGVAKSEGVIHLAFNHDFSTYMQNCADDRRVIETLGSALSGSGRPLIVTSGTGIVHADTGGPVTEDTPAPSADISPRAASEEAAAALVAAGGNVSVMRLPQVHDTARQGLVTYVIYLAQEKGALAYVGDGANRWPAAHVSDVARLYRLALEKAEPGATYHAVAEEGVSLREIGETVAKRLNLPVRSIAPEEAEAFFGWMATFAGADSAASSEKTRQRLGWQPSGPGLIADLERLEVPVL